MAGLEGLLAGRTLVDRYRVEEVIGRGGFAAVYRAVDERLGRTVAVKVITLGTSDADLREQIRRRFDREARLAAGLHHPNVVTVYDFGTDPELELDFLVMELLRGSDLRAHLARPERFPPQVAVRVLRDAAWGLGAGHAEGLIHRDVKPGNIFLAQQEREGRFRVCILDFGIAQIKSSEDSVTRLTKGPPPLSPAYASPEQLREQRELTPASDVFSLGVIGYQMLTGARPFGVDEVRTMGRGQPVSLPALRDRAPGVPGDVEAVILGALAFAPEERFPDARAMAEALEAAYAAMRQPPEPAPPAEPVPAVVAVPPPVLPPAPEPVPVPAEEAAPPLSRPAAPEPPAREPVPAAAPPGDGPSPAPARPARRRLPAAVLVTVLLLAGALAAWWALARDRAPERQVAAESPALRPTRSQPASPQAQSPPPEAPGGTASPRPGSSSPGVPSSTEPSAGDPRRDAGTAASPPAAARPEPAAGLPGAPASRTSPRTTQPAREAPRAPASPERVAASTPARSSPAAVGAAGLNREGERLFERGETPAAVERFRAAVRAAPGNAYYRNNLGWALFLAGDMAGAERELQEAIRLDPRRDIAYANLGEVRWAQGDRAAAIAAYERFLELNSNPRRERIATEKVRRMRAAAGATP